MTMKKISKYIILYGIAIAMILPFLWMISTSFKSANEIFTIPIKWIPSSFNFKNFSKAISSFPFVRFFINSVTVTIFIIIGQLVTSVMSAYAFARMEFKGKNLLFIILLAGLMLPAQTIMIPMILILKELHLLNTLRGIIIPFTWSALIVFLLRQFFMKIPKEIEEAAMIDGCSTFRIVTSIVLPISKPILSTSFILIFIYAWNQYFWPLLIVNKEELYTLQLGLAYFKEVNAIETDWGALMAGTTLTLLPVIIVFVIFQKKVIESIAFSGGKE
ncbi:carbohydrate ABC transporter permease [Vallitalea sp.]|uniref:carbohydrate ABC transporter permease n=1 Tax=Vallitalea sp. TaxID=1882829 RepID=UPI0025FB5E82|nr:carbohydrate ABC transporter permease [Vallitalea sp.]MCT4688861.1 carbohydrate ABC transporter permease [Vallitalea sp.]